MKNLIIASLVTFAVIAMPVALAASGDSYLSSTITGDVQ